MLSISRVLEVPGEKYNQVEAGNGCPTVFEVAFNSDPGFPRRAALHQDSVATLMTGHVPRDKVFRARANTVSTRYSLARLAQRCVRLLQPQASQDRSPIREIQFIACAP